MLVTVLYFPTNDVIRTRCDTFFAWLANISFFPIFELASIKQLGNSLFLSKTTKNTPKITVTSTTVSPGEIKVQNKNNRFDSFWRINMTGCVIRSPADYMAAWKSGPLDAKTRKKTRTHAYDLLGLYRKDKHSTLVSDLV